MPRFTQVLLSAFWVYGVVEPLTGWQWTQEHGKLDTQTFQTFRWRPFSYAPAQQWQSCNLTIAPAHRARAIEWQEFIIPIFQPPHCPELNPIERLWQFLKGLWKGS